jgi:hypothetical protein
VGLSFLRSYPFYGPMLPRFLLQVFDSFRHGLCLSSLLASL